MGSNLEQIARAMRDQPWGITEEQGRLLYEFVMRERPEQILELGCGIGTSACYMAAALAELGRGKVTSIDRNPDLPGWVTRTFDKVDPIFRNHHELVISPTSYIDELLGMIEANSYDNMCIPVYDFCFIDGAHTWDVDGFAFFLCEKLLKPGKWFLFDDLTWTISGSAEAKKHLGPQAVMHEIYFVPQVTKIFQLLVAQHPGLEEATIVGDWGWARKRSIDGIPLRAGHIQHFYSRSSIFSRVLQRVRRRR